MMSDGVRDTDITYGRLKALKKEKKTMKEVAVECLRLADRPCDKVTLKRCVTFVSRALEHAARTIGDIRRQRDSQDESYFLNKYCGLVPYLESTVALPPIPVAVPVIPLPNPSPALVSPPLASGSQGAGDPKDRLIKNLRSQLYRARKKLLSLGLTIDSNNTVDSLSSQNAKLTTSNRSFSRENSILRGKVATLSAECTRWKTELRFSENARLESEEALAESNSRVVTLFEGKRFTDDTVVTVLELLDLGVADEKMGRVMEVVAKLTGVKLDKVPSPSTVRNIAVASLSVAKAHVYERLDQAIDRGDQVCLYSDETNKLGSKLQCFGAGLVKDDGGQEIFLFGLAHVADKSAQTAFDIMQKRLGSLSRSIGNESGAGNFIDRFFAALSCAMSDRAATQLKFNSMIEEYRKLVLPKVIPDWETLSDTHRQQLMKFHVFYCQLHVIANYTNVVLEALAEHERIATGRDVPSLSPTAFTVVKEVARLFGDRSAGLHACSKEFKVWADLDQSNCESPFPSFLGHRFNVVFLLASRIFSRRQSLKLFINERAAGRSELIKLGELLDLPIVNEHLQILGLLDQLVTGPLWRLAENVAHVLDTGATVSLLLSWVRECRDSPVSMFSGTCSIPSLHSIAAGDEQFLENLLSVSPTETSLEAVTLVMESSLRYFGHLFEDFVPGGQYSGNVDDVVVERTRCASATNRFIESAFGFVDRLFTHSPNMRIFRREAKLLMSKNHTMAWLSSKTSEERQAIVSAARSSIKATIAEEAQAKKLLGEAILQKGLEKEKGHAAKVALQVRRRNQAVDAISSFGFVTNVNSITALLDSSSEPDRANALVAQIRFRERALQQPPPEKGIYKLSKDRAQLPEAELKRRLVILVEADQKGCLLTSSVDHPFTGCSIRRWDEDASEDGVISSVEKRGAVDPCDRSLLKGLTEAQIDFADKSPPGITYPRLYKLTCKSDGRTVKRLKVNEVQYNDLKCRHDPYSKALTPGIDSYLQQNYPDYPASPGWWGANGKELNKLAEAPDALNNVACVDYCASTGTGIVSAAKGEGVEIRCTVDSHRMFYGDRMLAQAPYCTHDKGWGYAKDDGSFKLEITAESAKPLQVECKEAPKCAVPFLDKNINFDAQSKKLKCADSAMAIRQTTESSKRFLSYTCDENGQWKGERNDGVTELATSSLDFECVDYCVGYAMNGYEDYLKIDKSDLQGEKKMNVKCTEPFYYLEYKGVESREDGDNYPLKVESSDVTCSLNGWNIDGKFEDKYIGEFQCVQDTCAALPAKGAQKDFELDNQILSCPKQDTALKAIELNSKRYTRLFCNGGWSPKPKVVEEDIIAKRFPPVNVTCVEYCTTIGAGIEVKIIGKTEKIRWNSENVEIADTSVNVKCKEPTHYLTYDGGKPVQNGVASCTLDGGWATNGDLLSKDTAKPAKFDCSPETTIPPPTTTTTPSLESAAITDPAIIAKTTAQDVNAKTQTPNAESANSPGILANVSLLGLVRSLL